MPTFQGALVELIGVAPVVGDELKLPTLCGSDLVDVTAADFQGKNVVVNVFPSVDTATCATSVRQFNQRAAALENTVVLCVSADLPFALSRFCGAEGIDNVKTASSFRSSFGSLTGLEIKEGPLGGLLTRAVIVLRADGKVSHVEVVSEIANEPDYGAAIKAIV